MASYGYNNKGDWCEKDQRGHVVRVIDRAQRPPVEITPYEPMQAQQTTPAFISSPATQQVQIKSSYRDRAAGFNYKVMPVAGLTAMVAGLVGWHFAAVPIISGTMLVILVGGFSLVWLAAYIVSEALSPDGVSLAHVLLGYGLLYRQQGEQLRQARERHDFAMQQARQRAQGAQNDYEL